MLSVQTQHKWRTNFLLVLIVLLAGYMLFSNHAHDDVIGSMEEWEEFDESRFHMDVVYKSPIDENLFKPWTSQPHQQRNPLQDEEDLDAGQWGEQAPGQFDGENPRIINEAVGSTEPAESRKRRYFAVWRKAKKLVSESGLYPAYDPAVDEILNALATARLTKVDVLNIGDYESGTAEKWLVTLEGNQKAVAKIIWEEKGSMKRGALCNFGFELPTAEIAAFHLHRVLGFNNTPYVTGRRLNLKTEVLPVATSAIANHIILKRDGDVCLRGTCTHCNINHTMCPRDGEIEVSLVYWVPYQLKLHTYPIKYMPYSTPRMDEWGSVGFNDRSYCRKVRQDIEPYTTDNRLFLDLFDFSALDTIMYHYDSKHYSLINPNHPSHGITVRLDHGRAFCAHDRDENSVFLAPIRQCCLIRKSSYERLKRLRGANNLRRQLDLLLARDPIGPVLESAWYPALERRLEAVLAMIDKCISVNGKSNVLVEEDRLHLIT